MNHMLSLRSKIKLQTLTTSTKIQAFHKPSFKYVLIQIQQPSCCSKCCHCCYVACLIITLILITVFGAISIAYFANWNQYGVWGKLIEVKLPENGWTFQVQAYCTGQPQALRPTIVLEHGGGSNSIAFVQLGDALANSNWQLCSYDRLGYGRSTIIPRYLTVEQKAYITNVVVTQLLRGQTNQNIIMGGWSAGVEISQVYTKLYPTNVKGLIFLDGYPDYLTLTAICKNQTTVYKGPAAAASQILRFISPFGADFIVGGSPITDPKIASYYKAYYQTGYFWESQYFDVANPNPSNTDWLTQQGSGSTVPYPSSSIPLNWPDISVPLLIMPANGTVNGGDQCGTMYLTQCQKYLDKCTNPNKQMTIMTGMHEFVLQIPQAVADQINTFFSPLF